MRAQPDCAGVGVGVLAVRRQQSAAQTHGLLFPEARANRDEGIGFFALRCRAASKARANRQKGIIRAHLPPPRRYSAHQAAMSFLVGTWPVCI